MEIKPFNPDLVNKYRPPRSHIAVGELCEKVGHEILEEYERFDLVRESKTKFRGQPFDRLCRKGDICYIVEIKGARHGFGGTPGHTQKKRMRVVLDAVDGLEPVLLQIDLEATKYKVRYGQEVRDLIKEQARKRPQMDNIINWVKETMLSLGC